MALTSLVFCALQSLSLAENQTLPQLIMFSMFYKKDILMLSKHCVSQIGILTAKASSLKEKSSGFGAASSISRIRGPVTILEFTLDSTPWMSPLYRDSTLVQMPWSLLYRRNKNTPWQFLNRPVPSYHCIWFWHQETFSLSAIHMSFTPAQLTPIILLELWMKMANPHVADI